MIFNNSGIYSGFDKEVSGANLDAQNINLTVGEIINFNFVTLNIPVLIPRDCGLSNKLFSIIPTFAIG